MRDKETNRPSLRDSNFLHCIRQQVCHTKRQEAKTSLQTPLNLWLDDEGMLPLVGGLEGHLLRLFPHILRGNTTTSGITTARAFSDL